MDTLESYESIKNTNQYFSQELEKYFLDIKSIKTTIDNLSLKVD